jgi:hypothetical protein
MAFRSGIALLMLYGCCSEYGDCCKLFATVVESGVPVEDKSAGDMSSWKLCLRFGFDNVLAWKRFPSSETLCKLAVWLGAGTGKVVALGSAPIVEVDSGVGWASSGELCAPLGFGDGADRFFFD